MLDNLLRIREPLAWAALAGLVAKIVVTGAQAAYYMDMNQAPDYAFWVYTAQANWAPFMLALVVAVWGCTVAPRNPRARILATIGAWVVAAALVAVTAVAGFVMLSAQWPTDYLPTFLIGIPDLVLGAIAVVALGALALRPPGEVDEDEDDRDAIEVATDQGEEPTPPDRPTVWNRTEATGTAWRTADEAATGVPGTASLASPEEGDDWSPPRDS